MSNFNFQEFYLSTSNIIKNFTGYFLKENKTNHNIIEKEKFDILLALNDAKNELDCASKNFDSVQNDELTNVYIYQIKAAQSKYQYLLRLAKEKNIKSGMNF